MQNYKYNDANNLLVRKRIEIYLGSRTHYMFWSATLSNPQIAYANISCDVKNTTLKGPSN